MKSAMRRLLLPLLVLVPSLALADTDAEVKAVAERYLNAITGTGDDSGRELLLGGVPMDAQLLQLENWRVASKDPVRKEEGDLAKAVALMRELDKSGRQALTKLMGDESIGDDLTMTELTQEQAAKLMNPTKERAARFDKTYPVLAYVARVKKEVYWHPKNPLRPLLAKAGNSGKYQLEVHRWVIETKEGPRQSPRKWPLRILRFKAGKVDTGWKILPASDWSVD